MNTGLTQQFELSVSALEHVVVTSTRYKPEAHGPALEIAELLRGSGCRVTRDFEGTGNIGVIRDASLVIAVGGDGTILSTARRLTGLNVPVLGVNLGKLGFLADHGVDEVMDWLAGKSDPHWLLSRRMMLELTLESMPGVVRYGLNDVILSQGVMTRLINIDMFVAGRHATQYRADGVVISTPTGSTAYSLSLGGPILSQGLMALVITPIAPHSLTDRPIVLDGGAELVFEIKSATDEMALIIDGQERLDLRQGDRFHVRRAPGDLLLVTSGERAYFDVLRQKLGWGVLQSASNVA